MIGKWCRLGLIALLVSGCDVRPVGWGYSTVTEEEYRLDGVKLITPSISDMQDPRSFGQHEYEVGPDRRLLLRLEDLKRHVDRISVDNDRTVKLTLTLAGDVAPGAASAGVQVCPVVSPWLMHATWQYALPFGSQGTWHRAGGDYETIHCAKPVVDGRTMTFDVKAWFVSYVRGQGYNRGLILLAESPVRVVGERGLYPPRLHFTKWVGLH